MKRHSRARLCALALAFAPVLPACGGGAGETGLPPARSGSSLNLKTSPNGGPAPGRVDPVERHVGRVLPIQSAEIGPKASGTIARIAVKEGDAVEKGDFLFSLDARAQRLGIQQAKNGLQSAILARDEAKRALARQQRLKDRGSISQAAFERAENAYKAAENGVKQANTAVSLARRQTFDSSVVAPFDGVIARKFKAVGETVTMMPPTPVVLLQDQTVLELRVNVPEEALRTLKVGTTITADFTAIGISRSATIERIQPTVDPVTRTVEIVAHVSNKDGLLRPGMYVEVSSEAFAPARGEAELEAKTGAGAGAGAAREPETSLKPGALAKAINSKNATGDAESGT